MPGGTTGAFNAISVSQLMKTGITTKMTSGDLVTTTREIVDLPKNTNLLKDTVSSLEKYAMETVYTKTRDDIPLSTIGNPPGPPTGTNVYNAVSADGNTIAIYYSLFSLNINYIFVNVYTYNASAAWSGSQLGQSQWTLKSNFANYSIGQTNTNTTMALKGQCVSISHDGNKIAIGTTDSAVGTSVEVYRWTGTSWDTLGSKINLTWWDLSTIDSKWCEMSGDGNNIVMYNGGLGEARVYKYGGSSWDQVGDLSGFVNTYSSTSGSSIVINDIGDYIAINNSGQDLQLLKTAAEIRGWRTVFVPNNTSDTDIVRIDKAATKILVSKSSTGNTDVYTFDKSTDRYITLGSISPSILTDITISADGRVISWIESTGSTGSYKFNINAVKLDGLNDTWSNVSDNTVVISSQPYLQTQNITNVSLSNAGERLIVADKVYEKTSFDIVEANTNYISPNLVLESSLWFGTAWVGKRIDIDVTNTSKPHVSPYGPSLIPIAWLPRDQMYPNHRAADKPLVSSAKSYFTVKLAQRSPQTDTTITTPIDWTASTSHGSYTQGTNVYPGMGAGIGLIPEQSIHFVAGYTDANLEPSTNDSIWRDPKPFIKVLGSTIKHLNHLNGSESNITTLVGGGVNGHYYYANASNTNYQANPKIGGIRRIVIAEAIPSIDGNGGTPPVSDRVWLLLEQDWNYYPYQQNISMNNPVFDNHTILTQILENHVIDVRMYKNDELATDVTTTPDSRTIHEQSISWNLVTPAEANTLLSNAPTKLILRESTMRPHGAITTWPTSPTADLILGKQGPASGTLTWTIKSEPYLWYVNLDKHEYPYGVTTGSEIIGGELDVSGYARFWNNVDISGVLEVNELIVHKESTIYDVDTAGAEFSGNITVNGNIIGNKELILAEHITTQGTQLLREYEYPLTGGELEWHWIRLAQYEGGATGTERSVCEGLFEVNYQTDATAVKHVTRFVAGGCVDNNASSNLIIYKKDLYINVIDNTGWRSSSTANGFSSDNAYIQGLHIDTDGKKMFVYAKVWKGDTTSKVCIRLWQNAHSETYTANTCWTVGSTITITTDKTTLPSTNWNSAISHYTSIDLEITDTAGTTSGGGLRDVTIGASAPLDGLPFYYKSTGVLNPPGAVNDDVLSNGMTTFTQPVNCHNTVRANRNLDLGNTKNVRTRALLGPNQKYLHHNTKTSGQVAASDFDVPANALTSSTNDLFIENVGSSAGNIRMNVPPMGGILFRALSTFNTDGNGGLFWSNPIEFKTHQAHNWDVNSFDAYFNHTNSIYDAKDVSGMNLILGTTVNSTSLPANNGTLQVRDVSGNNLLKVDGTGSSAGKITMQGWKWTTQTNPIALPTIGGKAVSDRVIFDLDAGTAQVQNTQAVSGKVLTVKGSIHILPNRTGYSTEYDMWGSSLYLGQYGTAVTAQEMDGVASYTQSTRSQSLPGSGNVYCNSVRQNVIFQDPTNSIGNDLGFNGVQGYQGGNGQGMFYNGGDVRHVVVTTKNTSGIFSLVKLPKIQEPMVGMQISVTRHNCSVNYNNAGSGSVAYKKPVAIEPATQDYINAPPSIFCGYPGTFGVVVLDPYNQLTKPNGSTTVADLNSVVVPAYYKSKEISSVTFLAMAGNGGVSSPSYNEAPTVPNSGAATGDQKNLDGIVNMGDATGDRYYWQVISTSGCQLEA